MKQQLADALGKVGVNTDEATLRRQLMMGEGENEGIDQSDFIQLMAIHMKRMVRLWRKGGGSRN